MPYGRNVRPTEINRREYPFDMKQVTMFEPIYDEG